MRKAIPWLFSAALCAVAAANLSVHLGSGGRHAIPFEDAGTITFGGGLMLVGGTGDSILIDDIEKIVFTGMTSVASGPRGKARGRRHANAMHEGGAAYNIRGERISIAGADSKRPGLGVTIQRPGRHSQFGAIPASTDR